MISSIGTGRPARALALAALGFAVLAAAPAAARADPYKDEKKGFSLTVPKKWKTLPVSPDEHWVAASFQSDREFTVDDAKTSSFERHKPQIDVVVMPKVDLEKKGGVTVDNEKHTISIGRGRT